MNDIYSLYDAQRFTITPPDAKEAIKVARARLPEIRDFLDESRLPHAFDYGEEGAILRLSADSFRQVRARFAF